MADIGEKHGLGPINFRQCFATFALFLIGLGIGDRTGDLRSYEFKEVVIARIELEA
ncbi:hypothetical protein [Ensifer adhaerens]|uniref:hypothetical protein n=1 Tax=Ensifer adhaerens TaxID=106592 RepID=UPI001CBB9DC6|nr:hypothetical protein [Ensifer adhaerens]MBZ7927685.1 hypothetical protein [Ensifer adhaerens]